MRVSPLLSLATLFLNIAAFAQTPLPDSSFVLAAKNQVIRQYEQAVASQEHVYEGNEYTAQDHRIKIHPFYPVDSLLKGTITYNGVFYHDVPILYDIVRDEVAVQPPEGGYRIRVHTHKISNFSLGQHQFTRIEGDSAVGVPTGFYEVLHDGPVQVLAHRQKIVHEDISSGSYKADYLVKDRFFVRKEGHYQEVKTKGSVLHLFPDQAKILRKYLRTNHLKFNDEQREAAITQTVKRYDELTH